MAELGKDAKGNRIQKRKGGFKTKKEAETALAEVNTSINKGTYIEPSKQLFKDYLAEWFAGKAYGIGKQTATSYDMYIRVHIIPFMGDVQLSKLNSTHIQNFITHLNDKGLASSTVKRIYTVVNTSLVAAARMKVISENPAAHIVTKPRVQRKEVVVWDESEVQVFLDRTKATTRHHIAFHLALATGMRQGEVLGLRWSDVDFEKSLVQIRQTVTHDGKEIKTGAKTASSLRSIAIDQATIKELKRHRAKQAEEKLASGGSYTDLGLITCTALGNITTPRVLSTAFDNAIKKSGVPRIRFHDLRHTHASMLLKLNINSKVVQERLGHSSIQMTLDLYSHLCPNMQSDAANILGEALFKNTM
ncbi:site-specific integrase [Paenibacillus frigoriresistens]|uniref:site-specific integrase n=1 Tax=Paenibacillus alginolyticus TaxID=59839 RepID=UPI0015671295|nr:site-specific integrase [Paenibacillus frigoriresistens]NRF96180.1 site-specific integrase [Paenibacillus frigoriresistens]